MIYMVDILVYCKKTLKLIKTERICEIYPLNGKAIFSFLQQNKDFAEKKELELSSFQLLDKTDRWKTLLDGCLHTTRQSKAYLKKFREKLDTYAVANQQLYVVFKTPSRLLALYITPKKENKDDVNNNP